MYKVAKTVKFAVMATKQQLSDACMLNLETKMKTTSFAGLPRQERGRHET